jgi:hypothetical protein
VFPDVAEVMAASLEERLRAGEYAGLGDQAALALQLTRDLRAVGHDKHLAVVWNPPGEAGEEPTEDSHPGAWQDDAAHTNFGFERVERLAGNVGYLDLRAFYPAEEAGELCAAAMSFLRRTLALIVDLRKNIGGEPSGVALLCSYFFAPEPVRLNDLYSRADGGTQQWWTMPWLPGARYLNKPVYVLTSAFTFSAAEELAYNLQALKRCTVVGETTGGGANPGGFYRLTGGFEAFIPNSRAINPVTGTNWEGTGVAPDVQVPAEDAQVVAYRLALTHVVGLAGAGNLSTASTQEAHQALHNLRITG